MDGIVDIGSITVLLGWHTDSDRKTYEKKHKKRKKQVVPRGFLRQQNN